MSARNVFRVEKRHLWKVLREIRDHYEEHHPLTEAVIALGEHGPDDLLSRVRAHRDVITGLGGQVEPLPELIICEQDDAWLLLPLATDTLFVAAWAERNWAITPVFGNPGLFSPGDRAPDEQLRMWLNTQLREGRCLRYPLLDATRLRLEADRMLTHDIDADLDVAGTVGVPIRV